jgi:hypothetical protein
MADASTGNLVFRRDTQREAVYLPFVPNLAALKIYADQIRPYSNAGIDTISFTQTDHLDYSEIPGILEDPQILARIMLRNPEPAEGEYPYAQVVIPAPKVDNFEFVEGKGYRIKQTAGEAIAAMYSALTSKTYEFRDGWICGGERS